MHPKTRGTCNLRYKLPVKGSEMLCPSQPRGITSSAAQRQRGVDTTAIVFGPLARVTSKYAVVDSHCERNIHQLELVASMSGPGTVQRIGSHGSNWGGALVRNGIDGLEGFLDAGTSTDENVHSGSTNIIGSYELGRSILEKWT